MKTFKEFLNEGTTSYSKEELSAIKKKFDNYFNINTKESNKGKIVIDDDMMVGTVIKSKSGKKIVYKIELEDPPEDVSFDIPSLKSKPSMTDDTKSLIKIIDKVMNQ